MVETGINQRDVMETHASNGVTPTCVTKNSLNIRHLEMNSAAKRILEKTRETGLPLCLAEAQ